MTQAVNLAALGSAGVSTGFKNRIINGNFDIWQRATSSTSQGYTCADRWVFSSGNSFSRSTDVPNSNSRYSVSVASSTNNAYSTFEQYIESANCVGLDGMVTVSFWAKSTAGSAPLVVYFQSMNSVDTGYLSGGAYTTIAQTTVANPPSTSWTKYTWTFQSNSSALNGVRFFIFRDAVGTNTTLYSQVQVEAGTTATNFDLRPIGTERDLCQRYYQEQLTICAIFNSPGVNTTRIIQYSLAPEMRTTPTVTVAGLGEFTSVGSTNRLGNNTRNVIIEGTVGNIGNYGYADKVTFSSEL